MLLDADEGPVLVLIQLPALVFKVHFAVVDSLLEALIVVFHYLALVVHNYTMSGRNMVILAFFLRDWPDAPALVVFADHLIVKLDPVVLLRADCVDLPSEATSHGTI